MVKNEYSLKETIAHTEKVGVLTVRFEARIEEKANGRALDEESFMRICQDAFDRKGKPKKTDDGMKWEDLTVPEILISMKRSDGVVSIKGALKIANLFKSIGVTALFVIPLAILMDNFRPDLGEVYRIFSAAIRSFFIPLIVVFCGALVFERWRKVPGIKRRLRAFLVAVSDVVRAEASLEEASRRLSVARFEAQAASGFFNIHYGSGTSWIVNAKKNPGSALELSDAMHAVCNLEGNVTTTDSGQLWQYPDSEMALACRSENSGSYVDLYISEKTRISTVLANYGVTLGVLVCMFVVFIAYVMAKPVQLTDDDQKMITFAALAVFVLVPPIRLIIKRILFKREMKVRFKQIVEELESTGAGEIRFTKKTRKGKVRYFANVKRSLNKAADRRFFKTACDLVFAKDGVLLKNNGNARWAAPFESTRVRIQPRKKRTTVEFESGVLNSRSMLFIFFGFPIWFFVTFFLVGKYLQTVTGDPLLWSKYVVYVGMPALMAGIYWYRRIARLSFFERGFKNLLTSLSKSPVEEADQVLESLPEASVEKGGFRFYRKVKTRLLIPPGTPEKEKTKIRQDVIQNVFKECFGSDDDGYLIHCGEPEKIKITLTPGKTETAIEFRSHPVYPGAFVFVLGLVLLVAWIVITAYGVVLKVGPGTEVTEIIMIGGFLILSVSAALGYGILAAKKLYYSGKIAKGAPVLVQKLDAMQRE